MKKKTILVVGGAGYIGSHMVKELLTSRYNVIIIDDLSKGHRELIPGGMFIKGSIKNSTFLDTVFSNNIIDAVIHFAASSIVGESLKHPLKYYSDNIAGTVNLLIAMHRHNAKRFIFSSSAAVYGEPLKTPVTENHPCNPTNPYGTTKLAVEQILKDCDKAYNLKYISLRYFNAAGADKSGTIGEKHKPETHLIPLVLKAATGELEHIHIFGTNYPTADGTCLRDYIHVSDLARAHLLALNALFAGEKSAIYNLGNSKGYSVRQIIKIAEKVTGKTIAAIENEKRDGDPAVLIASSDKICKKLGWRPKYEDIETIIKTAWTWHKKSI